MPHSTTFFLRTSPHRRGGTCAALVLFAFFAVPTGAVELTLTPDEPTDLSGLTFLASQTVLDLNGVHTLRFDGPAAGLPDSASITGIALLEDGAFLFSVDTPFEAGGTTYLPRDVIRRSGSAYSLELDGAPLGVPLSAQIDAVARLADGRLALSFDVPETVGAVTFLPADIAVVDGGTLAPLFDAAGAGLAPEANVAAFDRGDDGTFYFAFDTPTTVGGQTFAPDQVARYDGGVWSLWYDGGLTPGTRLSGLSLPGSPGNVTGLKVARGAGDVLDLTWDPSCSTETDDFAVYEGAIPDFTTHTPVTCTTGGSASETIIPAGGSRFFLVTALNGTFEGSFGAASSGAERSVGSNPCRSEQRLRACP